MKLLRPFCVLLLLPLLAAPASFAWGSKGHTMINHLAAQSLPDSVPAFLRTPEAINEIAYLGPEPDRWRSRAEPELAAEQAPDHFIDMELADLIGTLPRGRYEYIADLYAYGLTHPKLASEMQPDRVGFQPYITEEVWQRLKSAMRDYRELSANHQDTKPVEAAILFYAGWLGHYVGDGSQPLHTTVQYNGWTGPNPNGYTTDHTIHARFETDFVNAAINESDVQAQMTPLHPIGDEWDDYLAYLRHTNSFVEKVYQLDQQHGFEGTGTPESRQFTAERIAAGASMLRDMIVAAWVKSADPVPQWHDEHAQSAPGTDNEPASASGSPKPAPLDAPTATGAPRTETDPEFGTVYIPGNGVAGPKLVHSVVPEFTDEARRANYQGTCIIGLIVGTDGVPRNVHVVRPLGMGLDKRAVDAVKKYRFKPALFEGNPVPAKVNVQVDFRIYRRSGPF